MKHSIAFWYEPLTKAKCQPPKVELHFNLWRDLLVPDSNFFDVGIKFLGTDGCDLSEAANSFSLFIPGRLEKHQFLDLSPLLREQQTLNAIFNDVVSIRAQNENHLEAAIGTTETLTIHRISVTDEVEVEQVVVDGSTTGTIFKFSTPICRRLSGIKTHYIRVRCSLDNTTRQIFFSDSEPSDWFFLSSFVRTELTEFRWNERRSFPVAIANRPLNFFSIATVHYFLVRDVKFELISAHTDFHKIRRLEDHLWENYLHGTLPGDYPDWRVTHALAQGKAREMIIYHWRIRSTGQSRIDDFIAFAKFRVPIPNLPIFAIAIVCLGGAGNAAYGLIGIFQTWIEWLWQPALATKPTTRAVLETLFAGLILLALAWFSPLVVTRLTALAARTKDLSGR
jgi:hypothetical protein